MDLNNIYAEGAKISHEDGLSAVFAAGVATLGDRVAALERILERGYQVPVINSADLWGDAK